MKINGKWVRKEFLERFKNQGRIYGEVDNIQLQLLQEDSLGTKGKQTNLPLNSSKLQRPNSDSTLIEGFDSDQSSIMQVGRN